VGVRFVRFRYVGVLIGYTLAILIYVASSKGTVLGPDSKFATRAANGAPYTAQTCERDRGAEVTKAKALRGVKDVSVFCI
jgi:hypothetical protein